MTRLGDEVLEPRQKIPNDIECIRYLDFEIQLEGLRRPWQSLNSC